MSSGWPNESLKVTNFHLEPPKIMFFIDCDPVQSNEVNRIVSQFSFDTEFCISFNQLSVQLELWQLCSISFLNNFTENCTWLPHSTISIKTSRWSCCIEATATKNCFIFAHTCVHFPPEYVVAVDHVLKFLDEIFNRKISTNTM